MDYVLVSVAALLVSAMALYSGFGLGTLLMPVFVLFFPVPVAIASTAVVHLANNLFRIGFAGRHADWRVVAIFGIPGAIASIVGALLLTWVSRFAPLVTYGLGSRELSITPVKLVVAAFIAGFAVLELTPAFARWRLDRKYLPLGGALSGFFGGLSGHQGALRSAVLLGAGLSSAAFIGTGSIAASIVDVSRVVVYGPGVIRESFSQAGEGSVALVVVAIVAA
ncbi:MAG: sulfite exporter TauE/SafE family protein, partial [Chloroflexota bacterium]|nr:sulfite exporter TauE/SafE family protein [Chloroflexota bacterium]